MAEIEAENKAKKRAAGKPKPNIAQAEDTPIIQEIKATMSDAELKKLEELKNLKKGKIGK